MLEVTTMQCQYGSLGNGAQQQNDSWWFHDLPQCRANSKTSSNSSTTQLTTFLNTKKHWRPKTWSNDIKCKTLKTSWNNKNSSCFGVPNQGRWYVCFVVHWFTTASAVKQASHDFWNLSCLYMALEFWRTTAKQWFIFSQNIKCNQATSNVKKYQIQ